MTKNKLSLSQRGFTLVELLIVIVIIGILAGVVIGVLNPVQQQNRARDASIRSAIDKMALSTKSLMASSPRTSNRAPTPAEFIGGVSSAAAATDASYTACTGTDETATTTCYFTISGIALPSTCAGAYNGDSTSPCNWVYYREPLAFVVGAKGYSTPGSVFFYSYEETTAGNVVEEFVSCPNTTLVTATFSTTTGCTSVLD